MVLPRHLREDDTPSYKSRINNFSKDDKQRPVYLTEGRSLQEYLVEQLGYRNLPERDLRLAVYLIGSIDEDGYLRRDLESVADDIAFTMGLETAGELERLLGIIHELEPAGIGARDLRECLLLQMAQMPVNTRPRRLARKILTSYFDEFVKKHYEKLMARLQISEDDFRDRRDPPPVAQARQPLRRGRHGHHALHHSGFHPRLPGRAVQPLAELLQRSRGARQPPLYGDDPRNGGLGRAGQGEGQGGHSVREEQDRLGEGTTR